jgi:Protein of unknown function DUF72
MPRGQQNKSMLTWEERRARRELRREKQREDNLGRAAKMHAARRQMEAGNSEQSASGLNTSVFVGCSGWFYWKWRGLFYPEGLPTSEWFKHYANRFDTVEINASFYSWPTVRNVNVWKRQTTKQNFVHFAVFTEIGGETGHPSGGKLQGDTKHAHQGIGGFPSATRPEPHGSIDAEIGSNGRQRKRGWCANAAPGPETEAAPTQAKRTAPVPVTVPRRRPARDPAGSADRRMAAMSP